MTAPLNLLVYGAIDSGVTDSLRIGVFRDPLAALGVRVRSWLDFADDALNGGTAEGAEGPARDAAAAAADSGEALRAAGLTALAWADVVLFRRWRSTHLICTECETQFGSLGDLDRHVAAAGHRTMVPDLTLRPLLDLLAGHPDLIRSKAVVYDTDDDVLDYPAWTGFAAAAARERDVVLQLLGLADLVTATTPVLAGRLARHAAGTVRVVRNAIDPAWYGAGVAAGGSPPANGASAADRVRVLYHGVPARLRDYEIARPAVDSLAVELLGLRRVWLGAQNEPRVVAAVDEALPWVDGLPAFAAALTAARPDIGLAPLLDEPFNRARSELHWLEYSMAGAATVATGFDGPGPYDPIRDGVDGLIARTPADWMRHLRTLATSRDLRAEIAGRARERVLAEYSVDTRAPEWADAYRWAAEHAGVGRGRGLGHRAVVVPGVTMRRPEPLQNISPSGPPPDSPPATSPLRVLVIGPGAAGASDALRFDALRPALLGLGVELVNWTPGDPVAGEDQFGPLEAAVGWSDVVVLRRHYRTWHACLGCGLRTLDAAEASAHADSTNHSVVLAPYSAIRPLIGLLEADPGVLGRRAVMYDTDDDVFSADLPPGVEDVLERDLVARILGVAGLVTCATPVLAERLAARLAERTSAPVRVIRNAIDPAWYGGGAPAAAQVGDPRVLYHGVPARLRDYEIARPAVDSLAVELPGLRRVWLGSTKKEIAEAVDEALPWADGLPAFAAALTAARPDIGLAPLRDTRYDRCRSELHWLEYSMVGAATVATGFDGPGPYDPIRDGVDGLIARTPADWMRHLRTLATSRDLRAEIAGRARERVLAEYSVDIRAPEWADAYRWAAEHSGVGRGRTGAAPR